jgi:hypothetical protein
VKQGTEGKEGNEGPNAKRPQQEEFETLERRPVMRSDGNPFD